MRVASEKSGPSYGATKLNKGNKATYKHPAIWYVNILLAAFKNFKSFLC